MIPFPFDSAGYLDALSNIGTRGPGDLPYLVRRIDGTDCRDAFGPWPYSRSWSEAHPDEVRQRLLDARMVSVVAFGRPAPGFDARRWESAGFCVQSLKPHFISDPEAAPLQWSSRTMRHLRAGRARWRVQTVPFADWHARFAELYARLLERRPMTRLLHFAAEHFARLSLVPELTVLGAFDHEGLGAALLLMRHEQEVHALHVAGEPRAYKTDGFYALFDSAYERWGRDHLIYWGGAPQGEAGAGIMKFKHRFANRHWPVWMIKAILRPGRYAELLALHGAHDWFPAYRSPR